ncbi:MAG: PIN domain-containing protein [Thaumarchaeota archaeon]|nr:PIN domain-containing protein [Nitrososphaerota archaeon]
MIYIDTSLIVAALDESDSKHAHALQILQTTRDKVVSELTLAELSSTLARREEALLDIATKAQIKKELATITAIIYILRRFKLKQAKPQGFITIPTLGRLYAPIAITIQLSEAIKLKTLDLLHLASAKQIKENGLAITSFATGDQAFERYRNEIEKQTGVELITVKT